MTESAHDFDILMNDGSTRSMSHYKGSPVLIVNVASVWGVTDREYKQLQQLHDRFSKYGLKILAFPCNQFGAQEPGTDEEILEFTKKYDFNGDITAKCDINKSDSCDGHPLWNWMIGQAADKETGEQPIRWNFTKFLLDGQGQVVCREHTKTEAINLTPAIESVLKMTKF